MKLPAWLRGTAARRWQDLGLVVSVLWAALVLLMALASADSGQNYVAHLLIVPIGLLWCLGYAVGWSSRSFGQEHASLPPSIPTGNVEPLLKDQPALWWASVLVCAAAIVGAFALQSGPNGRDLLHQVARLLGSTFVIAILATILYTVIGPRTSMVRARFFLATSLVGAAFVLWQALDDTKRLGPPAGSALAEAAAAKNNRVAETRAKARRQTSPPKTDAPSEAAGTAGWADGVSEALRRHSQAYLALASKWDDDVAELQFETMLTPVTLTSAQGRRQNRDRLSKFESLLADYLSRIETLQRDYRADVLEVHIPEPQRAGFLEDFERAYAASVSETKELNAEFERVELEIAKTILSITDLMEREENAVAVGSDGKTLLFESDAAADEYNTLLKALEKTTVEEDVVMAKSNEAFRKRTGSLGSPR